MKNPIILLLLFVTFSYGQTPCVNGYAGDYPCSGLGLQSQIPFTDMGATNANDAWGWTDPLDGKEYAIVGLDNGTAFIDISNPTNPIYLGKLPSASGTNLARDIKTYNNHAFIVSEASNHGMQIFDLTHLRDVANPPATFTTDAHYTEFSNAHNLAINEETGFAYALRTNTFGGGLHFIDIQDPLNPVAAGGFTGVYTHDAQIVNYQGPDTDYTGRELAFSFNGYDEDIWIIDLTNKSNPVAITDFNFTNSEHSHQGWLTEDHKYLIMGDEADEINLGLNSRTIIFDISDLDNPVQSFEYYGDSSATDHNGYVKGDNYYLANYAAGLRVIDISNIDNGSAVETGYFDVYPPNDNAGFNGSWSVYPYFESGNILVSALTYTDPNYTGGFFLVKDGLLGVSDLGNDAEFSIHPNPVSNELFISSGGITIEKINVYSISGQRIQTFENSSQSIDVSNLAQGMYFLEISTSEGNSVQKFVKD